MLKPTRAHHRTRPGPGLDRPFFVTGGLIAVVGLTHTITLPTGATWPGLEALGDELLEDLQPSETLATRGAETRAASASDVLAGLALVQAQMLRSGPITAQLVRLERHEIGEASQRTRAALLNVTRESLAKVEITRRNTLSAFPHFPR